MRTRVLAMYSGHPACVHVCMYVCGGGSGGVIQFFYVLTRIMGLRSR